MIQTVSTQKPYDTAIVGAGILGLWAARHAIKRGERVTVIEKRSIGAGASGGFLGALMPHMPDNWNAKKQFQYDGLDSLADVIAELEEETGLDCGYRRCGRVMPLTHEKVLPQVDRRLAGALSNWDSEYQMSVSAAGGNCKWLDPDFASFGVQHDTLAARINPRAYLAALESYVRHRADLLEGCGVVSVNMSAADGEVVLVNGESFRAQTLVIANGWEAYPLLQSYLGPLNNEEPIGRGVKGQAVLLNHLHDDDLPIVYHDGSYVVPHAGNRVAIGSTSVNNWTGEPHAVDVHDMDFYHKAVELVPALKDAEIVDQWAGVRPRNTLKGRGTAPWFGPVPEHNNLIALIGGFKITLGVAHICSRTLQI